MDGYEAGTVAVVFYGDNYIELAADQADVTLADLKDSFGLAEGDACFVRERATGGIAATLPFETLRGLAERAAKSARNATEGAGASAAAAEDEGVEEPLYYDLIAKTAAGPAGDDDAAGGGSADSPAIVDDHSATDAMTRGSNADDLARLAQIAETMRQFAELGPLELLSPDTSTPAECLRDPNSSGARHPYFYYDAADPLGVVGCGVLYPTSAYSPYRRLRDPLHAGDFAKMAHTAYAQRELNAATPYTHVHETYGIVDAEVLGPDGVATIRPDLQPLTDAELTGLYPDDEEDDGDGEEGEDGEENEEEAG